MKTQSIEEMLVSVYDADGDVETLECMVTLKEWREANPELIEEADALARGETVYVGGGAAPFFKNVPEVA